MQVLKDQVYLNTASFKKVVIEKKNCKKNWGNFLRCIQKTLEASNNILELLTGDKALSSSENLKRGFYDKYLKRFILLKKTMTKDAC